MKKIIAFLLVFCLLFSIAGCTGTPGSSAPSDQATEGTLPSKDETVPDASETEDSGEIGVKGSFTAGFARAIVTPKEAVPLAGMGNTDLRISTGYLDDLFVECTALNDGMGNTLLLFTSDLQNSRIEITSEIRKRISEQTGVPEDHILMTATHTHSSVALGKAGSVEAVTRFVETYKEKIVLVGTQAIADLKPAKIYWGVADCSGYNFVKHYFTDLGETVGDNYGMTHKGKIVRHTTEANGNMYLLKLEREGAKDICLMNWRAHATLTGGSTKTDISADFVSPLRETIEEELGCYASYYQGEAGNMNAKSRIESEDPYTRLGSDYVAYGRELAGHVIEALKGELTPVNYGPITTIQTTFSGKVNHSQDSLLGEAQRISNYFKDTNDLDGANMQALAVGISSLYACHQVVKKASLGLTFEIEIHATRIGDLAFLHCPNEVFDSLGMMIREGSPTEYLFIMGYSNEYNFYIPSQYGYEYGSYEADCSYYQAGEGEKLVAKMVSLLQELYK